MSKETSKSHHQAARQIHIDGLTRMHARVIRTGEFSKDDLIQLLAQARATLELERKESAGMVSLLPKVAVAVQKQQVQGKAGDSKNAATNKVKERCLQALKDDPSILAGNTNTHAATILATRVGFAVNSLNNAEADGRKDKYKGSLTIKTVAGWIGGWKGEGEI